MPVRKLGTIAPKLDVTALTLPASTPFFLRNAGSRMAVAPNGATAIDLPSRSAGLRTGFDSKLMMPPGTSCR